MDAERTGRRRLLAVVAVLGLVASAGVAWWAVHIVVRPPVSGVGAEGVGRVRGGRPEALAIERALEREVEERIESLLGAVVGPERVIARVAATVEHARVERTEESVDPDRTALVEQRTVRGAGAERPDATERYEVSKVTSRTVAPAGAVRQLSIAVVVNGASAEELERLRGLVKSAAGFSEARGDRLEMAGVPFHGAGAPRAGGLLAAVGMLVVMLAAVVVLAVVRRGAPPAVCTELGDGASESAAAAALPETAAARPVEEHRALAREEGTAGDAGESLAASLGPLAPDALARLLEGEHPQVAALVLANLRPPQAAAVLAALPPPLQADLVARWPTSGACRPTRSPTSRTCCATGSAAWRGQGRARPRSARGSPRTSSRWPPRRSRPTCSRRSRPRRPGSRRRSAASW
jgi:hypothetical protein